MERRIATWHIKNDLRKTEVGELLIDGNHLEFYSRFHGLVFPKTLIGEDGKLGYKVFVNGYTVTGRKIFRLYFISSGILYFDAKL